LLVEVKVQSLGLDRSSNTPVVILEEVAGERVLPIWIGPSEATAIAMQLADMEFSRPLTHDLLVAVLGGLGGTLKKVIITRVEKNTYYAELLIHRNGEVISVDARPSDSIAVALRVDARIFAQDELMERASIEVVEDESTASGEASSKSAAQPEESEGSQGSQRMKPDELKEHLRRLNPEDFGRFTP
jgi:bifunctional DNase/RNase